MTVPDTDNAPDADASEPVGAVLGPLRAALAHAARWAPTRFERREQIDGIAALESARCAVEALQARWTLAFARSEATHQTRNGQVEPEKIERSIGAQVGLACRVSPTEGLKRVRAARDLNDGLDHLRGLFGAGEVSAYRVSTVVGATSHLDGRERAEVDRLLATRGIERLGVGRLRDLARSFAAQVAPEKFRLRCTAARPGRRVTLSPTGDGLTDLVAHLPAEIPGHGAVPVDLLATTSGRKAWRRIVTRAGVVIGGDSTQHKFTGFLADLVRARDSWRCSEPYCDAPIRQIDHIHRRADGGRTTFDGGRGTCVLHNLLREDPEWTVERTSEGVRTTSPTGHRYTARRGT